MFEDLILFQNAIDALHELSEVNETVIGLSFDVGECIVDQILELIDAFDLDNSSAVKRDSAYFFLY